MHLTKFLIPGMVIVLVLAIGLGFVFSKFSMFGGAKPQYAAVYLTSGDLYFGKLSRFPKFSLDDAWFLQPGGEQGPGLARFEDAAWKPAGSIHFNSENIAFWTLLAADSPVIQAIEGRIPPSVMPAPAPQQQLPPQLEGGSTSPALPPESDTGATEPENP